MITRGFLAVSAGRKLSMLTTLLAGSLCISSLLVGGCRKKAPPTAPATAPAAAPTPSAPETVVNCPGKETFAPMETAKGRVLVSDCVVYAPGRYWLATTLSYEAKTGKAPKLAFLTGGFGPRITVFDIEAMPAEEITKLVAASREVGVKIRRTRSDTALVRLGVVGTSGEAARPETREVGLLLQLVAHAPPKILWVGPGDQTTTGADGCITEQVVDFELLFRTRLERFTTQKSRPAPGGTDPSKCASGGSPSTQESVAYQPVALKKGRPLHGDPLKTP